MSPSTSRRPRCGAQDHRSADYWPNIFGMPQQRGSSRGDYGWRKRFSDEQTELIKSVVMSMPRWWGKDADLDAVAAELNSRLGPIVKPDEIWDAQKVRRFLTGAQRRIKREGSHGAWGTVNLETDDHWVVRKPDGTFEGIPKTDQVIIRDGRGRRREPRS
jgi:hypothetical protein